MKFFDISLLIKSDMIAYPGNTEVEITPISTDTSTTSRIVMGSHSGTHVDAPRHVFANEAGVDTLSLSSLIGPCRVLDMTRCNECVRVADLKPYRIKKGERLLVKTKNSHRGFEAFRDDFIYLDGDAADFLAERGLVLFGIDYLSIKKRGGADTRPHTSLLKKKIIILEGIDLSRVSAGRYTLHCLPLRFEGLDGSPCRAVLAR